MTCKGTLGLPKNVYDYIVENSDVGATYKTFDSCKEEEFDTPYFQGRRDLAQEILEKLRDILG